MAQIIEQGGIFPNKVGCTDPLATNYDPNALIDCVDCCKYNTEIIGCKDVLASNYNPLATTACNNCCLYREVPTKPSNIFQISENIEICPPSTCVGCDNFDWWNDTYIANHDGQSLQVSSPTLWQQIVNLVTNSGQTFYVNSTNGELLNQTCCTQVNGTYGHTSSSNGLRTLQYGICFCEAPIETFTPQCISDLTGVLNLISTPSGYTFFITNFQTIGTSLGLTTEQINFIIANIVNNTGENDSCIPNLTEARLILMNALTATGGFYVNFSSITNNPILVTQSVCSQYNGYWDGTNCMCNPIVNQCDIDITEVEVVSIFDFYNNQIQIVQYNSQNGGQPISEACCNRLIKDYKLPWAWQNQPTPACYATPKDSCLPVLFSLNSTPMSVPPCGTDLEISMWVYFGKPANPCQTIPNPPDTDVIVIDGVFCDITLTPNTGAVQPNPNVRPIIPIRPTISISEVIVGNALEKPCCYNTSNPILARVSLTDPTLNSNLTQVVEYNSSTDYFDRWVQIKATLPSSGLTLNFGVNLEIYQGLNCCCDYDIFIDDIKVNCATPESALLVNDVECPGFNITRVIDNKKSWVYNPGLPDVGISEYDGVIRSDSTFGLLNGHGVIDRTFAPSLDADIPWRYTDYWQQSSVYERHSSLVLNSKELELVFDMCADCPVTASTLTCLSGFTLSANTSVCYDISGNTTSAITVNTISTLSIYELKNYKKQFQSFWIPFMEQFIPATTLWVAGERWCSPVCTVISPCDYDFELVEADVSVQTIPTGFLPSGVTSNGYRITIPSSLPSQTTLGTPNAIRVLTTPLITPVVDLGLTTTRNLTVTNSIDIQAYRNKFTKPTTETIII